MKSQHRTKSSGSFRRITKNVSHRGDEEAEKKKKHKLHHYSFFFFFFGLLFSREAFSAVVDISRDN